KGSESLMVNGTSGNDIFTLNGSLFVTPPLTMINGMLGSDTLIGTTGGTWNITDNNAGSVSSGFYNASFSSVENLTGGDTFFDVFVFANGKGVSGKIDGGAPTGSLFAFNRLDYSAYTTAVTVNLATGAATGVGGGVANFTDVVGGMAADTLT